MKWSVQQVQSLQEKGLQLDELVDFSELKKLDSEIREITPVRVKGDGSVTRNSVTFQLEIAGSMTLPCARTLNDVEYPFTMNATEVFQLNDWATFDEDEEVHQLKDNMIDLVPFVQERILLEKPLRVFSDKEEGPAPKSGSGWELTTMDDKGQEKVKVDPRLKELEKFFDKK
ncbi:hypothetical protein CR203_02315 [Salipaludibacillus neizhouensis]|uniref:DUF177 domain-containing protein n=1 Tax=Salipaludibacillus neizhouensis TaxID=885475 RepID=A0A3A9KM03_9BACI|nr:YceD family protein [Salipaludibacillus neizhouensis]RKL68895.1 hypothetical protein CR203_02315 [Salipaludibacillus neizhouensis]